MNNILCILTIAIVSFFIGGSIASASEVSNTFPDLRFRNMANASEYALNDGYFETTLQSLAPTSTGVYIRITGNFPQGTSFQFSLANAYTQDVIFTAAGTTGSDPWNDWWSCYGCAPIRQNVLLNDNYAFTYCWWNGTCQGKMNSMTVGSTIQIGGQDFIVDHVDIPHWGQGDPEAVYFKNPDGSIPQLSGLRGNAITRGVSSFYSVGGSVFDGQHFIPFQGGQAAQMWYKIQLAGNLYDRTKTPIILHYGYIPGL